MSVGGLVRPFPRRLLDEIGAVQERRTDIDTYVPRIREAPHVKYVARSLAEDDPSRKQIIPYVLVRRGGARPLPDAVQRMATSRPPVTKAATHQRYAARV